LAQTLAGEAEREEARRAPRKVISMTMLVIAMLAVFVASVVSVGVRETWWSETLAGRERDVRRGTDAGAVEGELVAGLLGAELSPEEYHRGMSELAAADVAHPLIMPRRQRSA
jgi:hypothetical protein